MRYERPRHRGKHRMYIGMAPGVGKTYRMLKEAYELKEEGIDVVVGILETHGTQRNSRSRRGARNHSSPADRPQRRSPDGNGYPSDSVASTATGADR